MSESVVKEIEAAEMQRYQAMFDENFEALGKLLGDDLVYTHSSASTDSKSSYIEALRSRKYHYKAARREDVKTRVYGDVAVVTGRANMNVAVHGADRELQNVYTNVWVRRAGGWQMVHWQSTPLPKA
jgi:ketosteroid isomerase-like protein